MHKPTEPIKPLSTLIEEVRTNMAATRRLLDEAARLYPGFDDRLKPASGLLTCGIGALHGTLQDVIKHEVKVMDAERGLSLKFMPRGIGYDVCPGCFVCGAKKRNETSNEYLNNIAAFVASKAQGEEIVTWFSNGLGTGARLDFRQHEPNWIQVKVGACDIHLPQLQKLYEMTAVYGVIRKQDILDVMAMTTKEA